MVSGFTAPCSASTQSSAPTRRCRTRGSFSLRILFGTCQVHFSPKAPGALEDSRSQDPRRLIVSLREWGSHGARGPSGEPRSSSTLAGASFTLRRAGLQESRSTHVVPGSRGCLQGLWGHLRRTARVCLNGWRRLQTLSIASTEFL